ncbi:MAG: YheU family protein [Deltaproteobacteria bacterium]
MEQTEVTIERDQQNDHVEDGVEVPINRINPETLRKMVEEFVTREWSDLADCDCTFEDKIEQVLQQLKDNKIKVVFDLTSETCNIVPADKIPNEALINKQKGALR